MEGVFAACVLFVFVCVIRPRLIRHRGQFHLALGLLIVGILLGGLAEVTGSEGFIRMIRGITSMMLAVTVLLLFLAAGGLSWGGLAREMKDAVDGLRGQEPATPIVPISKPSTRERTDAPASSDPTRRPRPDKPGDPGPIPLE